MEIYAQIRPETDFETVSGAIKKGLYNNIPSDRADANKPELFLHPMQDWHLNNEFENGQVVMSNQKRLVWLNGLIGLFYYAEGEDLTRQNPAMSSSEFNGSRWVK